jgi:lysozyme
MQEITQVSESGLQFLIKEEGLVKRPYLDAVGIPTIGVGMTYYPDTGKRVTMKDPALTTEKAMSYFKMILRNYELPVYSVTRDDINHNQFDSLASICFNIGGAGFKSSTLVRRVNANKDDFSGIKAAFLMWSKAGGKTILQARREREAALYARPDRIISLNDPYVTHVKHIQTVLGLIPDGIFGINTKAAVVAFQKKNRLIADGIVGPQTLAALNKK